MTETRFTLFTIIYTAIAAVFTFNVGPEMVKSSNEIDGTVLEYNKISHLSLRLKKQHEGSKYIIGDKVYDTLPFNTKLDTTKRKIKYLVASMTIDTFSLNFDFDIEAKKGNFINFLDALNDTGLINKTNYKKEMPKLFNTKDLKNLNIKMVLEKENDFNNPNNYIEINGKKIQGYNIKFRKMIATVISYFVWILSCICLVLIPISGCSQLRSYHKTGLEPYIPNRWKSIKNLFNLFSKNKK